jgi:hypothetical protein
MARGPDWRRERATEHQLARGGEVMRSAFCLIVILFVAEVRGADDDPKASATLGGKKMLFPEKGVAAGVKATTALLESCCSKSDGSDAELKKAREGNHVRLVFLRPIKVTVLDEKLDVSELVFTQPLNTGVFWLRAANGVVRCSKYRFEKEKDFVNWRNEARIDGSRVR